MSNCRNRQSPSRSCRRPIRNRQTRRPWKACLGRAPVHLRALRPPHLLGPCGVEKIPVPVALAHAVDCSRRGHCLRLTQRNPDPSLRGLVCVSQSHCLSRPVKFARSQVHRLSPACRLSLVCSRRVDRRQPLAFRPSPVIGPVQVNRLSPACRLGLVCSRRVDRNRHLPLRRLAQGREQSRRMPTETVWM